MAVICIMLAKALYSRPDIYMGMHREFHTWLLEEAMNVTGTTVPFHPGAVKYFKEAGLWTAEHEKWQKEQLCSNNFAPSRMDSELVAG